MLLVGLISVVLALIYYYFTNTFSYWKDRGVKFLKPYPFVGSLAKVMLVQEHLLQFFQRVYKESDGERFIGFFQGRTPALLIRDTTLIKNILVKDFAHFTDHGLQIDEDADPLEAKNLFNMRGHRWKEMRAKLTPTFTSGRMKAMFPLVEECALELEKYFGELAASGKEFEAKDILGRYTTDVIGSCAFGIACNSLRDPNCEFRVMGKKLIDVDFFKAIKMMIIVFLPEIGMRLRLAFINKELTNFFRGMVRDVIALRKKTGITRKDFMQLLLEIKEKGSLAPEEGVVKSDSESSDNKLELTDDDLTAQATVFFLAGFETSSTVLGFALLELAMNPDVQVKAREEIERVIEKHDGQVTYQAMVDMKYLDCILDETMRMYPPVSTHMRICTKKYVIPDTKISIEEGTFMMIPAYAIQNDPQYFPDPERFNPERFNETNRADMKSKFVYLPFGEGPRQCIGNRFAVMQSKMGLIALLRKHEVLPCPRMKYPVVLDPKQFIISAAGGVWVKLAPYKKH